MRLYFFSPSSNNSSHKYSSPQIAPVAYMRGAQNVVKPTEAGLHCLGCTLNHCDSDVFTESNKRSRSFSNPELSLLVACYQSTRTRDALTARHIA